MEVPRHWRLKQQRYALVGEICRHCEAKLFPPRDVCPSCGGDTRDNNSLGISVRAVPTSGIRILSPQIIEEESKV